MVTPVAQVIGLSIMIGTSVMIMLYRRQYPMVVIMGVIISLLLLFTLISRIMIRRGAASGAEIHARTITWWWMASIFMLAVSTHKIISFCLMGFLCYQALAEYFSLVKGSRAETELPWAVPDKLSRSLCYLAIPLTAYLAYIQWYGLYIIVVPVYVFLLIPIVFVLQNKTKGVINSMGLIAVGLMFFVFNLGHSLFMINMGAMVLLFCFFLTETRDLLSYWIGKGLERLLIISPENLIVKLFNNKISSNVSPKKTWGAGLLTTLCTMGLALIFVPLMPEFPQGRMSGSYALILGAAIGFLGQMGDLVFSMFKRDIGIKDSGHSLPGHGGIIDRVDSLIFTIPITFHLLNWKYF